MERTNSKGTANLSIPSNLYLFSLFNHFTGTVLHFYTCENLCVKMILSAGNKFIALLGDNWYEGYVVSSGHKVYSDFHFGYWEFCHHRHKEKAIDLKAIDLTGVSQLPIVRYFMRYLRYQLVFSEIQ